MSVHAATRPSLGSLLAVSGAAALLAAALATAPANASVLDYQGAAFTSAGSSGGGATLLASDASLRSNNPVRRRSPRYDGYGRGYRPRTFATLGLGGYEPSDQPGSGLFVVGSIGTEFQSSIDLGLSASLYHRSTGGSQFVTTFEDPAGNTGQRVIETSDISTDLVPLMAFLRVKFPAGEIQPYVGAGIGWEWLLVEGTDADGFAFSDDYDGFGAQIFGGINFNVSPNSALYGEVLYNSSTVSADFYDPTFDAIVRDEIDMDGAAAHAGLRFRF